MHNPYSTLLSPLLRRGFYIRNRMGMSRAYPPFSAGVAAAEPLPYHIAYTSSFAKNGAAIVTCRSTRWQSRDNRPMGVPFHGAPMNEEEKNGIGTEYEPLDGPPAPGSMSGPDLSVANVKLNYIHTVQSIHDQGSLAIMSLMEVEPSGWSIDEISAEALERMTNDFVYRCRQYQALGFDGCSFYMCYRSSLMAQALSPACNHRADKYGTPTALSLDVFSKVRNACGDHFLLEIEVSGQDQPGGYTLDDMCRYLKAWEPYVDIVQVRAETVELAHPIGANSQQIMPITLAYAKALKESGTSLIIAPVGGFQEPEENEAYLQNGWVDMIYMARAYICDSHYYEKILAGKSQDIIPCIRCNKCHTKPAEPNPGCSVNPLFSLSALPGFQEPTKAKTSKKVAVIGGGPAGMVAALTAQRFGHTVTLYEKQEQLGGQLIPAGTADFKWPVARFRAYLVRQMEQSGVHIRLGCEMTAATLEHEKIDALILAMGAVPVIPSIPGAEHAKTAVSVYGQLEKLGQKIVVVGGAETGLETSLFLARSGRDVLLLTRQHQPAYNAHDVHYREILEEFWQKEPHLQIVCHAECVAIEAGQVVYRHGNVLHTVSCDDVVISGGMQSCQDQLTAFAALSSSVAVIGDCRVPGDIRMAVRDGYTAACRI